METTTFLLLSKAVKRSSLREYKSTVNDEWRVANSVSPDTQGIHTLAERQRGLTRALTRLECIWFSRNAHTSYSLNPDHDLESVSSY